MLIMTTEETIEIEKLFNYVAGRVDWEPFPAELTQLVFIGPHLMEVQGALLATLRDCEV
jgi:hypothetical protein